MIFPEAMKDESEFEKVRKAAKGYLLANMTEFGKSKLLDKKQLENLGYKLSDHGSYWRTNALYRAGDNTTALQIYKDSGVWKDYVEQTPFMPLEKLIKITLGTTDQNLVDSYIKKKDAFSF